MNRHPPLACVPSGAPWLQGSTIGPALPSLNDAEGHHTPPTLPVITDSHVHLFPDRLFDAVWNWFDNYGWPIRYKLYSRDVLKFLFERGVERVVGLCYAHKAGMARSLNDYMADLAEEEPRLWGLGTVFPGEPGAEQIIESAFARGLRGLKLHCHVQCFSPDDESMEVIYRTCERWGRPILMHAGREPSSPHYKCDPHELCSAERINRVLSRHPALKLCVPHLGANEFEAFVTLIDRHPNLWLDTTMCMASYFPAKIPLDVLSRRPNRILYGSDFPNLPYAWDRELRRLEMLGLDKDVLTAVCSGNANELFGLP